MAEKSDNNRKECVRVGSISFGRMDDRCWYVARIRKDKNEEEVLDNYAYYGTPRAAALTLVSRMAGDTIVTNDLRAWVAAFNTGLATLEKALLQFHKNFEALGSQRPVGESFPPAGSQVPEVPSKRSTRSTQHG